MTDAGYFAVGMGPLLGGKARECERKRELERSHPPSAGGRAWLGALAWKPWEAPGFPKAVGRQGRGVVCAGDRQDVDNTACPGCVEGLLLALGTAFTGSSAKSGVWRGSSSAFRDTVEPTFQGGVRKWQCLILLPSICLPPQATA